MNITCSALPETLLESELFGHERGAFTGADRQKRGLIESADGGTVFLDEIGEMVPLLQAKLLRFLEEKSFKRVGGSQDVSVDVRVVAATNRSLQEEVKKGHFREDLYYRLNVMAVPLPPLRERKGDVPLLIAHYIDTFNTEFRKKIRGVAPAAMAALQSYPWRGNVRELRNAVERAMLLAEGNELTESHFPMLAVDGRRTVDGHGPAARGDQSRGARTLTGRAGARTQRLEPDQGRDAARPEPRSDPLPHREIRPAQAVGGVLVGVRRSGRHRQRNHRAAGCRALDGDLSALRLNQALGRGHAQPGASRLGRLERAEQRRRESRRESRGRNRRSQSPSTTPSPRSDTRIVPLSLLRLSRVDQQVLECDRQQIRIAQRVRHPSVNRPRRWPRMPDRD